MAWWGPKHPCLPLSSIVFCFIWDVSLRRITPPYFLHASRTLVVLRSKKNFPWPIWWPISPFMASCAFLRLFNRRLSATGWHVASFVLSSDLEFVCHYYIWYGTMYIYFFFFFKFMPLFGVLFGLL